MHTRSFARFVNGRTRIRLVAVLMLLALAAAACGGDDDGPSGSVAEGEVRCPLTGVEASDDAPIDRPALAVKVDNAPPARPPVGLEAADIIFEELGEGGLTRFLSFFHCDDAEDVGPVRSARNVDVDILQEFGPVLFGYSGANDQVLAKIESTESIIGLKHGDNADAFRRESSRNSPYNLFSSTEALRDLEAAGDVEGLPSVGFEFDPELLESETQQEQSPAEGESPPGTGEVAEPAETVAFEFSPATRVRYTYDADAKRYLRFHGDTPHNSSSGEQLGAVNVVILKTDITEGEVRDASGSPTMDTSVVGSGEAVVVRAGQVEFGTWNRSSLDSNTTLETRDGETIALAPGNTWVHYVEESESVDVQ
ncbi:MAG: DUF3048 domain-containing protein [Actinobacteria bacterium]|nr:DUF3048 domain-containing protein [Actinomycetota bacterium]